MTVSPNPLRKVAIVLASLDADSADALLEQMGPEMAVRVRQALIELESLDAAEQEAVVQEFLREGSATKQAGLAGVEIEAGLAEQLKLTVATYRDVPSLDEPQRPSSARPDHETRLQEAAPFAFLEQLDADDLLHCLEQERPQTVAVILSYLPAVRSAELVPRLPAAAQAAVLRRVSELGEFDAETIRELERGLRQRLARRKAAPPPGRRGPGAVASILKAATQEARGQLLESLAAHEPELAARFAPPQAETSTALPALAAPRMSFDDLAQLSELTLARIFAECDSEVLLLALAGAHPSFARRMLEQLPAREARLLRRRLERLGPTRLSDVEEAQSEVVTVAQRLHALGRIELSARRSLSLTI